VLLQQPDFSVLLGDELLIQGSYLYVGVVLGKVEVGREAEVRPAFLVPSDVEGPRLVLPLDLVKVEQLGKLAFRVVSEVRCLAGKKSFVVQRFLLRDA
jgi:hypothetical protein